MKELNFIQFRLAKDGSDDDIKEVFIGVDNLTERAKELLRVGIRYYNYQHVEHRTLFFKEEDRKIAWGPLTWSHFPSEPTVKNKSFLPYKTRL